MKIKIFLSVLFFVQGLEAFQVSVTNVRDDMVSSKKICAHVIFEDEETALYRDTLCISVDSPDLELKGWRTLSQAPSVYTAGFKKTKRLFTEPFNLEILIDFDKKVHQKSFLDRVNLSIAALVLLRDGHSVASTGVVPLCSAPCGALCNGRPALMVNPAAGNAQEPLYLHSCAAYKREAALMHKREISEVLIIDRLIGLGSDIRVALGSLVGSFSFYKWYVILWAFFLWFFAGWFYPRLGFIYVPKRVHRELFILIALALLFLTWSLMRVFVSPATWLGTLSGMCVPGAVYYLWESGVTVFGRFKILLGIVFAVLVLPLLVLACIHGGFLLSKPLV